MPKTPRSQRPQPEARPERGGRLALGAGAAVLLCCVGHTVLLVFGIAWLGAAAGAFTGTTAVLTIAAIALAVTGALVALRLRRRRIGLDRTDSMSRTDPAGRDLP